MKVVERYIFNRALVLFFGTMAAVLAMVWITQALTRINLVTTNGQSALVFIKISTFTLPSIIPEVLPFAMAIAAAQTLVAMNNDSELVVISAAGSPRSTVMRPLILLGLLASIASFLVSNMLDPLARIEFRKLLGAARADLISVALQEGTFREIEKGLYIQVNERAPGGELVGVFVADSRQEGVDLVYYAKNGTIADIGAEQGDGKILLMRDGLIQRKVVGGDVSTVKFNSYMFDLTRFAGGTASFISLFPKDRSLAFLLNPDPNDLFYKKIPGEFRAELHRRLIDWSLPLIFALIAVAVAGDARSHRESRLSPLLTVMMLALFVRWLGFMAFDRAEKQPVYIYAIYGVPLVAAATTIWFIATNRVMELPIGIVERIATLFGRVVRSLPLPSMRRSALPGRRVS